MYKLAGLFLDILLRVLHIKPILRLLKKHKVFLILLVTALFFLLAEGLKTVQLQELLEYKKILMHLNQDYPLTLGVLFFSFYLLMAAISVPGVVVFNVIGGFILGFAKAAFLSVFAMSMGSALAFLLTRHFFRDFFINRGGAKIQTAYRHLKGNEVYYLFAFRLLPLMPSFFTNIIMGLSFIKFHVFFAVSFITFLPYLAIYANIGSQLSHIESLGGLMDSRLIFALALIGLFPLFVKYLLKLLKKLKSTKEELPLESDGTLFG